MSLHNLIVLDCGDIIQTSLHNNLDNAQNALYDFICDHWHDEDSSPEDHSPDDAIEWFFEHYEDYRYHIDTVHVPKNQAAGADILLTPGMCAIVRNGLARVDYGVANELLADNEEWDEDEDNQESGAKLIGDLIERFE